MEKWLCINTMDIVRYAGKSQEKNKIRMFARFSQNCYHFTSAQENPRTILKNVQKSIFLNKHNRMERKRAEYFSH